MTSNALTLPLTTSTLVTMYGVAFAMFTQVPWWLSAMAILVLVIQSTAWLLLSKGHIIREYPLGRVALALTAEQAEVSIIAVLKYLLLLLGIGLLIGVWKTGNTLESSVGFAYLCLVCKWLELKKPIDYQSGLVFSIFVVAMLFLIDTGLANTFRVLLVTVLVLAALQTEQQRHVDRKIKLPKFYTPPSIQHANTLLTGSTQILRSTLLLLLLALPLVAVMYVFFPRIDPLWRMQLSRPAAKTGLTDTLTTGDIANLTESTELAFTAIFTNQKDIPSTNQRYFRGLVLGEYNGVSWTQSPSVFINSKQLRDSVPHIINNPLVDSATYSIHMEPTGRKWLISLEYSLPNVESYNATILSYQNLTYQSAENIDLAFEYSMHWVPSIRPEYTTTEANNTIQHFTKVPSGLNPRTQQLSQQLYKHANGETEAYVNAVLQWFKVSQFSYTLSPPLLTGSNRTDHFLFTTKQGFCEHYATSFAILMRMQGIPSRVVTGYQGGEVAGNSLEVRQMDAHAWTEVWLTGRGWVRIDPTLIIAPQRIDEGMASASTTPNWFGSGLAGQYKYHKFNSRLRLSQLARKADYYWRNTIVGYDRSTQQSTVFKKLGITSAVQTVGYLLLSFAGLLAIILGIWYGRNRAVYAHADRLIFSLSKALARHQLPYLAHQTVSAWLSNASTNINNDSLSIELRKVIALYNAINFNPKLSKNKQKQLLIALKKQIKICKKQLQSISNTGH